MHSFSFPRKEHLKNAKTISGLFENGFALYSPPLRALWEIIPEKNHSSVLVAFSVSKNKFKRAVDRNLLKRRMLESYRKNKNIISDISELENQTLHILFSYSKSVILPYNEIEKGVIDILMTLKNKISTR